MRVAPLLLLLSLPLAAGCGRTSGAPRPDKETQAEIDRLQGVWKVEAIDPIRPDGPEKDISKMRLAFKDDIILAITKRDGGDDRMERATYRLKVTTNPKQIDIIPLDDDGKPERMGGGRGLSTAKGAAIETPPTKAEESRELVVPGIYKFEGDKLILAIAKPDEDSARPTAFQSRDEKAKDVRVFTLVKTTDPVPEYKPRQRPSGTTRASSTAPLPGKVP